MCGPVELPVDPARATVWPCSTVSPTLTVNWELWLYAVTTPWPWSISTRFPPVLCTPANTTVPDAVAFTGVPVDTGKSVPTWNWLPAPVGLLRIPNVHDVRFETAG